MRKIIRSFPLLLALCVAPLAHAGYEEGLSAFRAGSFGAALAELMPAAKAGNADAQQLLGHMYYMGQGVAQDFAQALSWHRKAAAQGKLESEYVIPGSAAK